MLCLAAGGGRHGPLLARAEAEKARADTAEAKVAELTAALDAATKPKA